MESEAINMALHRYVVAVLRARDCADDLALQQTKASDSKTGPSADIDGIPDSEVDGTRASRTFLGP
jgi:hypothetical protein